VADEYDPWPAVHMPIVSDIQQQFLGYLGLNPAMKDGNDLIEIQFLSIRQQELHINMLKLHGKPFFYS